MLKFVAAIIALLAVLTFSPILCAQTATPTQPGGGGAWGQGKWNNAPPSGEGRDTSAYARRKSGPAPRRDLSGIWDGTASGGVAAAGARSTRLHIQKTPRVPRLRVSVYAEGKRQKKESLMASGPARGRKSARTQFAVRTECQGSSFRAFKCSSEHL